MLRKIEQRDLVDIFPNLPAVRNGVILPAVWSGMRIGTCGSHFIGPHLRGPHQLIIGRQSCDAMLRTEGVGASYNIRDIREAHKKDSESAPQTTVADELKENLEAVENFKGSRDEKLVVLYCKQLGINYKNLSDEEFRWLIRILKKSKKMGTPISQRKKR